MSLFRFIFSDKSNFRIFDDEAEDWARQMDFTSSDDARNDDLRALLN